MSIIKPLIISATFLVGYFLIEGIFLARIKHKKIYCILIEIGYFLFFWAFIYIRFI